MSPLDHLDEHLKYNNFISNFSSLYDDIHNTVLWSPEVVYFLNGPNLG